MYTEQFNTTKRFPETLGYFLLSLTCDSIGVETMVLLCFLLRHFLTEGTMGAPIAPIP